MHFLYILKKILVFFLWNPINNNNNLIKTVQITRDKVEIYYVEGTNHMTILDSDKVIAGINGDPLIDPKLFKKLLHEDIPLEIEEAEYTRAWTNILY